MSAPAPDPALPPPWVRTTAPLRPERTTGQRLRRFGKSLVAGPRARTQPIDWINPICIVLLAAMGLVFIFSAHAYRGDDNDFWVRQSIWLAGGAVLYLVAAGVRLRVFLEQALPIYLLSLLLLLLLPIVGVERNNARSWLVLGPFSLQPSETAKVGVLLLVSAVLARTPIGDLRANVALLGRIAAVVVPPLLLIFVQPDLGSSLVFPPLVLALLFVARFPLRFFAAVLAVAALGLGVLGFDLSRYVRHYESHGLDFARDRGAYEAHSVLPLRDYQRLRLLGFLDPERADPRGIGASWNYRQSLISVGTGGLLGKGWMEGTQARLGYLPQSVAHNDFIFSVLAEESGFAGGAFVIVLFGILIINTIRIAASSRDRFGTLVASGVAAILLVHVVINVGMTLGLMPITGLPLPFVSYGGSFALGCCFLLGLVQGVHRWRRDPT